MARKKRKVQGGDHGSDYVSGPVYGSYAIYVSKSTVEFPTSQTLALLIKSKTYYFAYLSKKYLITHLVQICDALGDLPFVQFKKREKHP